MKFYKNILTPQRVVNLDETICKDVNGIKTEFLSSSSCLIRNEVTNTYYLNVRFVNYVIDDNGQYHKCDNYIITMNKFAELSQDLKIIREKQFDLEFVERRYIGIEDVRIFKDINNDCVRFIGTGYHSNNQIGVVSGNYNINENNIKAVELKCLFKNQCEKNWVFVNYHDTTLIVYNWFPLQLCKQELNDTITIVKEVQMPRIFSYARGSSSGFQYKDELWFVIHLVSHESPRHYYHLIVVFDKDMNLKRYSAPFKFEGTPIEFCLSIVVEEERVLINYSTWDRTTRIGVYNKDYIDSIVKYIA